MAKAGSWTIGFGSGCTNGRQLKVTATSSGGAQTLHTSVTGTADIDVVTVEAVNTSGSDVDLTVLWGGTTSPDDEITKTIPAGKVGPIVVVDRRRINNGLAIKVYASSANVVNVYADVDTYTITAT